MKANNGKATAKPDANHINTDIVRSAVNPSITTTTNQTTDA